MLGKGLESLIPKDENLPRDIPQGGETAQFPPLIKKDESVRPAQQDPVREKNRPRQSGDYIFHIEVEKIKPNPFQPRREFKEENLRELADSIREFGIIQPLIVSKVEKEVPTGTEVEYELIAGERRLLAAKLLGLPRVPVIVKKIDFEKERLEMAVIENLQRENLNPLETARAYARLQDEFRLTQREVATRIGKSRETIANTLRLLDLPSYIQDALARGEISESHGRLLLSITDQSAQGALFRDLVDRHLTTRELKTRVGRMKIKDGASSGQTSPSPELSMFEEQLSAELGAPVKIETHGDPQSGGGKITIVFYSGEELKGILKKLGGSEESP